MGVTLALEEEKVNGVPAEDSAIQGVKIGMMGPLAGVGDPVFWLTARPILGALAHLLQSAEASSDHCYFFVHVECNTFRIYMVLLRNSVTKLVLKLQRTCLWPIQNHSRCINFGYVHNWSIGAKMG